MTAASAAIPPAGIVDEPEALVSSKAVLAACIGTALEWYDVFIYLYFALVISNLFFPRADPTVSLLVTVATFGLSYLAKPLGALFFSTYADRVSRKQALTYTLLLMSVGVAIITFAPTYASIGVWASVLMLLARLIQGFSSGGEYGSSTAFLVERSPFKLRGFYSSFNISAIGLTSVLGGVVGLAINNSLTPEQISGWGWRLPFAAGLLIIPASIYLRQSVPEVSARLVAREAAPFRRILREHKKLCALAIGAFSIITITNYSLAFYMPTYAIKNLGLSPLTAFFATMVYGLLQCLLSPVFGYLSDRSGRRRVMLWSSLGLIVTTMPCFYVLVTHPSLAVLLCMQLILGILATAYQAAMPALLCDLFPPEIRATGVAVVHDLTATVLGGFTPFIITLLIASLHSNLVAGGYVLAAAILAFVRVLSLPQPTLSQDA